MARKRLGNVVSNIILVAALAVFLYSAHELYGIFSEYSKGSSEYEAIQEMVITQSTVEDEGEEPVFFVDFERLQEINSDVVGWIRFEEPEIINYPIVQGQDNSKYLKTTFEGNKNSAGTLFIDVQNQGDFSDRNTFIYGHNMKNGSMFGRLRKYKSSEFCQEHPYFYLYTPDGIESTYQIFSVTIVNDTSESYTKMYTDDVQFQDYIEYVKSISLYQIDREVEADSKIVSLSTCTNVTEDERLLIHAVKVSEKIVRE